METKLNFPSTEKYFSLTNFFNGKQTQKKIWKIISQKKP
jgi:hypothetical protein